MVNKKKNSRNSANNEKLRSLEGALEHIKRRYGDGAIMRLDGSQAIDIEAISTGSLGLDRALGVAGLPKGRITEIYGPESSGKTTLALQVVASCQKNGGIAAFVDAEHALDPGYAKKLGVNLDQLYIAQPDYGEQAMEIVEALVASEAIDCIVIDSVAALVPKAELEGEMTDTHVGLQARLMSKSMRKLSGVIARTRCCVVFINQIREKIGVMFGSPETTPGGRALKYYSSVRIDIRRIGQIKVSSEVVGNRTRAKVVKNKVAAPFRIAEFDIVYNKGICFTGELLDAAIEEGLARKRGAWFSYGDIRLGQGRENSIAFLEENVDIQQKLQAEVIERLWPAPVEEPDPKALEALDRGNGTPEAGTSAPAAAGKKAEKAAKAK